MKNILRGYGVGMTQQERQVARSQAADLTRTRGTTKIPQPPRDIICQPASRGVLVTWNYPQVNFDIQRWRVYKDDELTIFAEIKDRGTRQCTVPSTAGVSPPIINVFVSSLNSFGTESAKVQAQGKAIAESGAPTQPTSPPEYNSVNSGGRDLTTDYQ
jgi:hypothetical protein